MKCLVKEAKMNITKRMLRFGAVAIAVAVGCNALAAGLGVPLEESFESYTLPQSATNLNVNWSSTSEDDMSVITNVTYTFGSENGGITGITYPLFAGISAAENHTQVLKLNTEGGTLSAALDSSEALFNTAEIYVDTMINMVLSEDDPSFIGTTNIKIAVFANAASNLVIRHGMYVGETHSITSSVTDKMIKPDDWYRLTITAKQIDDFGSKYSLLSVAIDGVTVTHANARDGDKWFDTVVDQGGPDFARLTSIAFQGTGHIDDLVVTRDDPFSTPAAFFTVYTVVGANGGIDVATSTNVASGSNLTINYTADDWYRIEALTSDGSPIGAAAGELTYEQVLTGITADISNNVSFVEASQAQTGLSVPNSWAQGFGLTVAEALADPNIATDYLLGLDPTGTYVIGFEITEIAVGTTVTVTCKLTDDAVALDTTINGELNVYGKEALTDAEWIKIGAATMTNADFDVDGLAVVESFDAGTYKFFKAIIE